MHFFLASKGHRNACTHTISNDDPQDVCLHKACVTTTHGEELCCSTGKAGRAQQNRGQFEQRLKSVSPVLTRV